MATKQSTADYIAEQCSGAGRITVKKMFGEYELYCDGKLAALICDDQLFAKPSPVARKRLGPAGEASRYPGAKPYLLVPAEKWDDADWLAGFIRASVDSIRPAANKKKA